MREDSSRDLTKINLAPEPAIAYPYPAAGAPRGCTRGATMRLLRPIAAVTAAGILLGLLPQAGLAGPATVTVAVRPGAADVQILLSASAPFRFVLRQLGPPDRLVIDLLGLDAVVAPGAQEVNLAPVRAVRLARGSGFVQVVVDLTEPVLTGVSAGADGRSLTLRLAPARGPTAQGIRSATPTTIAAPPPGALPTEVIRLQHLKPREVAAHLQALLPWLVVRPDEATGSLLLAGPTDLLAKARQLVTALDAPPATAAVTEVVAVKFLKAEALAPMLAAIFPRAQVRAEARLSAVVLAAAPALLARAKAIIAALDVPPAAPSSPAAEVLRPQHADPVHLAGLLAGVLPQVHVRVDPATRTLTLSGPPEALAQAKATIQQVDVPSPTAPASEIVRVRTADPEALARALQQAVFGLAVTPDRALGALILQGSRSDVDRAKAILAAIEAQPAPTPAQMRVEVIPLRHTMPSEFLTEPATSRSAEDVAQTVQAALQPIHPELRITVEKRLQALIATGTQAALAAVRDLVERLDRPSPQVSLEVRVVEVAANALANLGVSLSPIVGTTLTEADPTGRPFAFGRTPLNITLILNLLVERGDAKILASPTVATIDGRKALIRTGDEIPLVTRQIYGGVVIENVVTFRAGVTLEIIPKITADGGITVILRPVVSTITGTTPQGAPQISTREVQTTLAVRDGETIVIGGLLEERDIVSMSRIPGLGDLPFFGRLFRSERREQRRTELVVTVTPRMLLPSQPSANTPPAP